MKSIYDRMRKISKDKRGVFGLTSVQQFFAIVLGLALLAYVIVVIMGTLSNSTILPTGSQSGLKINETGSITGFAAYRLAEATNNEGFTNPIIIRVINATSKVDIQPTNFTVSSSGYVTNTTAYLWQSVNFTYSYNYNAVTTNNANAILGNTSGGIVSFFSAINPVYAILAILVIILVLVVLVRVVTGGDGRSGSNPQL